MGKKKIRYVSEMDCWANLVYLAEKKFKYYSEKVKKWKKKYSKDKSENSKKKLKHYEKKSEKWWKKLRHRRHKSQRASFKYKCIHGG